MKFRIQRPDRNEEIITFDKYDGRALLDTLPTDVPIKYNYDLEYDDVGKEMEVMLNFERYKILIEAYKATGENNYLNYE